MPNFSLESLSRYPDIEGSNLFASDATDAYLLAEAREQLANRSDAKVVTIGDRYGALTLGAAEFLTQKEISVFQDSIISERALQNNSKIFGLHGRFQNFKLGQELFNDADLVLLQLPKSLLALQEILESIASFAPQTVKLLAGGRVKHMSMAMTEMTRRFFTETSVSLAQKKSRLIRASGIKDSELVAQTFPVSRFDADLGFEIFAMGATFGSTKFDHGTRFLLESMTPKFLELQLELGKASRDFRILDLGSGNGTVATFVARTLPSASVFAVDESLAAVMATAHTVKSAGVEARVTVSQADACEEFESGSLDLVILNPPFHSGASINENIHLRLFESAARALKDSGEMYIVANSHLKYLPSLAKYFKRVKRVSRSNKFTVTHAKKA